MRQQPTINPSSPEDDGYIHSNQERTQNKTLTYILHKEADATIKHYDGKKKNTLQKNYIKYSLNKRQKGTKQARVLKLKYWIKRAEYIYCYFLDAQNRQKSLLHELDVAKSS